MAYQILVVDDEKLIVKGIKFSLEQDGMEVTAAYDGEEALQNIKEKNFDLVVLDVMLPERSGFEVVRALRAQNNAVPVLLLTARDEISDKVTGLDCGADDYMTKPFSPEELLARVRALSRRQGEVQHEELRYADLCLNLSTRTLSRGEKSVSLGYKEFEVLHILLSNPRAITPKEELITRVWGADSDAEDNNVEAYISFLRKKFFYLGSQTAISAVRKVGYRLEAGV